MPDDACNAVKSDLLAGTFTRFTKAFPIYIENEDDFQGGNEFIILRNPRRDPVQTVSGSVLYTKRSCTVEIKAPSTSIRDNIYDDIIDILIATNRGYKIERGKDRAISKGNFRLPMDVSMLL